MTTKEITVDNIIPFQFDPLMTIKEAFGIDNYRSDS